MFHLVLGGSSEFCFFLGDDMQDIQWDCLDKDKPRSTFSPLLIHMTVDG